MLDLHEKQLLHIVICKLSQCCNSPIYSINQFASEALGTDDRLLRANDREPCARDPETGLALADQPPLYRETCQTPDAADPDGSSSDADKATHHSPCLGEIRPCGALPSTCRGDKAGSRQVESEGFWMYAFPPCNRCRTNLESTSTTMTNFKALSNKAYKYDYEVCTDQCSLVDITANEVV